MAGGRRQWLTFVEPKGLRNLDLSHPKLGLYKEVKIVQKQLAAKSKPGEPELVLTAFVLSATPFNDIPKAGAATTKEELEKRHVLFMDDGGPTYLMKLILAMCSLSPDCC